MKKIFILIITLIFLCSCAKQQEIKPMYKSIRQPAVAGQFYPEDKEELKKQINKYLAAAPEQKIAGQVKAMMVPHAGYDFSGPVAAYGYKLLVGQKIKTIVLIGNSHHDYFSGLAIEASDSWQTPLGMVEVDQALAKKLVAAESDIKFNSQPHQYEHSLEVQLPFLQTVLTEGFKIVPILFGNEPGDDWQKLAQALTKNLGPDDLVIASSDMSHYPANDDAQKIDQATLEKVKAGQVTELEKYINQVEAENVAGEQTLLCGVEAVKTIMALAGQLNWTPAEIIKYANSWQTSKLDENRVVGYGVVAFSQSAGQTIQSDQATSTAAVNTGDLNNEEKDKLLEIAVTTVEEYVKQGKIPDFTISDQRLNWHEGAFVTLYKDGKLRGCIGQILPTDQPLWLVVRQMAVAACSQDNRFTAVSTRELKDLKFEVSVLSQPEKIDDWHKIELGKQGVIVSKGLRTGVFLPQVATETGWGLEEFLAQLCWQKAGLAPDSFKTDPQVELEVFTAQVFSTE